MKTIDDLADQLGGLRGRRVLVRSDLNVPLDGTTITDDGRIRASVPTIRRLADAGARVIVVAHLGRPKGVPEERYTLRPVAVRLSKRRSVFQGALGLRAFSVDATQCPASPYDGHVF